MCATFPQLGRDGKLVVILYRPVIDYPSSLPYPLCSQFNTFSYYTILGYIKIYYTVMAWTLSVESKIPSAMI